MAITKKIRRDGIVRHEVITTDLQGDAETITAEIEAVDPDAEAILLGYIAAADKALSEAACGTSRWRAARATRIHARESIQYLKDGDAELATWNALQAARNAWIADVKQVEPEIVTGARAKRQRSRAGFSSSEERKAERRPEWDRWQARFDELHAANPKRTKSDISAQIAHEFGRTREAVARRVNFAAGKKVGTERPRSKE